MHNHGASARIGVIPRFLQSSVWDATDVKRLTCLPSRVLEGRRGRQTIDLSAVPQILGCARPPAAHSGCRSPPPIAPTGYHPAWRKYATRLSVGIMAAWRRRTVEEIPMMPQQPSTANIKRPKIYETSNPGKPQTLQMALLQGYMPVQTPLIEQIEQPA